MIELISLKDFVYRGLKDGYTLEEITNILKEKERVDGNLLNSVNVEVKTEIKTIWEDNTAANYYSKDLLKWYYGPKGEHIFWNAYKNRLIEKGFSSNSRVNIDKCSSKIVSFLKPPGVPVDFNCRGIVLGYVQSGKTANFLGVISKAADMGYKLFIILSGITNSLRNQTESRIREDIFNQNQNQWRILTPDDDDFNIKTLPTIKEYLQDNWNKKFLCVMKKNSSRLQSFITWIGENKALLEDIPLILIDDECDQASLNTNTEEERTEINKHIIKILSMFPKITYIGYTATPYANLLVNPKDHIDLYPREFILSLPKPKEYTGSECFFDSTEVNEDEEGNELDSTFPIKEDFIPISELELLIKRDETFNPKDIPETLKKAILYFWLGTAYRWWREENQEKAHSTMLIHTHQETDTHVKLRDNVQKFKDYILERISNEEHKEEIAEKFKEIWNSEKQKMDDCTYEEKIHDWPNIDEFFSLDSIKTLIQECIIVMQNSREDDAESEDDLFNLYQKEGNCYIAIGGNMLSRGLTLDGLIVSYYVREAQNYDTILQMGRWFGFRKKYLDLIRLWTTEEIYEHFIHIADVDKDIREQIERNGRKNLNPSQFPIRIPAHDNLSPTAEEKMSDFIKILGNYGGRVLSTSYFYRKDVEWLENNITEVENLINTIKNDDIEVKMVRNNYLFKRVSSDIIKKFLSKYKVHPNSRNFVPEAFKIYLDIQKEKNNEIFWNVILMSKTARRDNPTINITDMTLNLFSRTRTYSKDDNDANIRALYSKNDVFDDLELNDEDFLEAFGSMKKKEIETDKLTEVRKQILPNTGLMLIYPIDRNSKSDSKLPLEAERHIMGITMYFPSLEGKDYIRVRIED